MAPMELPDDRSTWGRDGVLELPVPSPALADAECIGGRRQEEWKELDYFGMKIFAFPAIILGPEKRPNYNRPNGALI